MPSRTAPSSSALFMASLLRAIVPAGAATSPVKCPRRVPKSPMNKPARAAQPASSSNFIRQIVEADLAGGTYGKVRTRFPPEPNGYLHFGHVKSICLNFELARQYGGHCNLRFDDTNPEKEEQEYVDSIKEGVKWLGYDWGEKDLYASDYFGTLYGFAEALIKAGHAYVDSQSAEAISAARGTFTEPGKDSPWRNRSAAEN